MVLTNLMILEIIRQIFIIVKNKIYKSEHLQKSRCSFNLQEKEECGVPIKEKENKQKNITYNSNHI